VPVFVDTNVLVYARVLTDELQHGLVIDRLRVVDPFRTPGRLGHVTGGVPVMPVTARNRIIC
jgi:predicted nucleic acid-binding protein